MFPFPSLDTCWTLVEIKHFLVWTAIEFYSQILDILQMGACSLPMNRDSKTRINCGLRSQVVGTEMYHNLVNCLEVDFKMNCSFFWTRKYFILVCEWEEEGVGWWTGFILAMNEPKIFPAIWIWIQPMSQVLITCVPASHLQPLVFVCWVCKNENYQIA